MLFGKKQNQDIENLQKTVSELLSHLIDLQKQVNELQAQYDYDKYMKEHPTAVDTKSNMYDGIPNCCRNCSNHPINGGSGICHCTLPYFENPTKWGITCDISNTPDITYNAMDNTYTCYRPNM